MSWNSGGSAFEQVDSMYIRCCAVSSRIRVCPVVNRVAM
jgi:hypothetical protein